MMAVRPIRAASGAKKEGMAIAQNLEGKRWKAVEGGRHHPKRRAGAASVNACARRRHIAPLSSLSPESEDAPKVLGIWSVKYIRRAPQHADGNGNPLGARRGPWSRKHAARSTISGARLPPPGRPFAARGKKRAQMMTPKDIFTSKV